MTFNPLITLWSTRLRLCNTVCNLFFSCGLHNEINWSSLNPLGLSRRCMAFSSLSDFLLRNKAYHHMHNKLLLCETPRKYLEKLKYALKNVKSNEKYDKICKYALNALTIELV